MRGIAGIRAVVWILKLSGLVEAWDTGDGVVRRELLATLFPTSTSARAT